MPDIMDVNPLANLMVLAKGVNGSGKSIAIASWLKKGSVYFFDYDGRMASVSNWYRQRGLKRGQLSYDTYGPDNVFDAYQKMAQLADSCPYSTIVVDSFTAVTVSAVTFSLKRRIGAGVGPKAPKTSKGDMIIPDWDEWNGEAAYVTMLLDLCKRIAAKGTNVFWTAHPIQRLKIEQSGNTQKVFFQEKLAAFGHKSDVLIPIYFNEIWHFAVETDVLNNVSRQCYLKPVGEIVAKTALNIPGKIEWTDKDFYDLFIPLAEKGQEALDKQGEEANEVKEEKKDGESPF